jgi:FAD/FMN-containing dehydrogenase
MKIANWNNQPKVEGELTRLSDEAQEAAIPRGMGRSYGDASLAKVMWDMTKYKAHFALKHDLLEVSAGFSLEEILNRIVPQGYTLPVIPGTRHVSVGGMIAADVHGKNHVEQGSIGHWILQLQLRLPDGREVVCSPEEETDLFRATIGGLGLTGVIISAHIRLQKIAGVEWSQRCTAFPDLDALIDGLTQSNASHKAAWFDVRSTARFFLLENAPVENPAALAGFRLRHPALTIPRLPFSLVSSPLMRLYNWNYARKLKQKQERRVSWDHCFFPLDRIGNWSRLYGPRGFYQLQCVFPRDMAKEAYAQLIAEMHSARQFPVLSVMKMHGAHTLPGMLSFTHPGISVAFDFINTRGTADFMQKLHQRVAELGGRIYLVKDALLTAALFEKMYPEAEAFRIEVARWNSGQISSLLAKRLNLVSQ